MKYLFLFFSLNFSFGFDAVPMEEATAPAASSVLRKTAAQLNSLHTVRYLHRRDYFTGEQHYLTQGTSFIDFISTDTIVRLKYQVQSGGNTYVFNGTECFTLKQDSRSMQVQHKPQPLSLPGGSFFYNSLVTLRRTLPVIASDPHIRKTLKDTTIDGKSCYPVEFSLYKNTLDAFGGFSPVTEDRTFSFQLYIDKGNYFPFMLIQKNNADEHSSKVTYENIQINPKVEENSWYYSTYLLDYKKEAKKETLLLPAGSIAPPFELPLYGIKDQSVRLAQYKGKVLLLEFWIRNCGPCIAAVPKLNRIAGKYKGRGVELVAINPSDTEPTIAFFVEKYKATYAIAYNGERVADAYRVTAYPSFFIVDAKGVILYAGGLDVAAIEKVLEKALP